MEVANPLVVKDVDDSVSKEDFEKAVSQKYAREVISSKSISKTEREVQFAPSITRSANVGVVNHVSWFDNEYGYSNR